MTGTMPSPTSAPGQPGPGRFDTASSTAARQPGRVDVVGARAPPARFRRRGPGQKQRSPAQDRTRRWLRARSAQSRRTGRPHPWPHGVEPGPQLVERPDDQTHRPPWRRTGTSRGLPKRSRGSWTMTARSSVASGSRHHGPGRGNGGKSTVAPELTPRPEYRSGQPTGPSGGPGRASSSPIRCRSTATAQAALGDRPHDQALAQPASLNL